MKISLRFAFVVAAGSLSVSLVCAADGASHAPSVREQLLPMDTDKDGRLSADEHADGARALFKKIDVDGDGKLTVAELDGASKGLEQGSKMPTWAARIKAVDTDGDGVLNAAEHAAASRGMFVKMDTDGDGYVTKAEMDAIQAKMIRGDVR